MPTHNKRISRLYLDRNLGSDSVALTERESNYLGNVLRLRRGDIVLAFNGRGQERHGSISLLARRGGELKLLDEVAPIPEPAFSLTLIQGLPKTDAMDLIVQKATELGVSALWPVTTDFSVVRLDEERAAKRIEHWQRIAQSACEQCGRHRPPDIAPVASISAVIDRLPPAGTRIVLDGQRGEPLLTIEEQRTDRVFAAVGPEGGFSPQDNELLSAADFLRVRLGPRTLRAETAALVACALLQAWWGDLR